MSKKMIAQNDLLQIAAYKIKGKGYEVHLVSMESTVVADVGHDEVKANSLYQQLAKRFADTIESELIFLKEELDN